RDFRIAGANFAPISLCELAQLLVDLGAATAGATDQLKGIVRCFPDTHAQPVIGEDLELLNIIDGLAAPEGVRAAGIIADVSAEGAVRVRGRIGSKGEAMLFCGVTKLIVDETWLDLR